MKRSSKIIGLCFLIPFFVSFTAAGQQTIKVAFTKLSPNYSDWITKGDSSVIAVDLFTLKPAEAVKILHDCSGLVLTGGGDIDPSLYNPEGKKEECKDIDKDRDALEKAMIGEALSLKMPVLGICRGEQMLNVFSGGSLITDIPAYIKMKGQEKTPDGNMPNTGLEQPALIEMDPGKKGPGEVIHQCDDYLHCFHTVSLDSTSLLRSIIGIDTGSVTTNHHQAIYKLGDGLKKNAHTPDGIIEGIEWSDPSAKSFMIGVQWHPERMDLSNPFSGKLLKRFLDEVQKFSSKQEIVK